MAGLTAALSAIATMFAVNGCTEAPRALVNRPAVPMRDGVKLALDVIRPAAVPGPLPSVLIQTRYWRSFALKVGDPPGAIPTMPREDLVTPLLRAGYAVVVADVRGTGASEGTWGHPWSPDEVADMGTLVDWIARQPWSDGRVGATGVSYEGTTALLAAACGHPALKAVLAREIEWDLLDELLAPGGVRNVSFPRAWSTSVLALDRGQYPPLFPAWASWIIRGVHPLDDDPGGQRLARQQADRQVADVDALVREIRHPEDPFGAGGPPVSRVGPSAYMRQLARSRVAIALWGGWWDGATADGVLRASRHIPLVEGVIGPWNHEGDRSVSPWPDDRSGTVDLAEVVRFFDRHLGGDAPVGKPRRRWFAPGSGRWKEGSAWPVTVGQTWFLAPGGRLSDRPPGRSGRQDLVVDFEARSAADNRWMAGMLRPVDYGDRRHARGQVVWQAPPTERPLEIFGCPRFESRVEVEGPEAAVHVYLEVVQRDGVVRYLTEGVQRTLGGRVSIPMRAIACDLRPGQALRVSVSGADLGTFERVPATGSVRLRIGDGPRRTDRLILPVASLSGGG